VFLLEKKLETLNESKCLMKRTLYETNCRHIINFVNVLPHHGCSSVAYLLKGSLACWRRSCTSRVSIAWWRRGKYYRQRAAVKCVHVIQSARLLRYQAIASPRNSSGRPASISSSAYRYWSCSSSTRSRNKREFCPSKWHPHLRIWFMHESERHRSLTGEVMARAISWMKARDSRRSRFSRVGGWWRARLRVGLNTLGGRQVFRSDRVLGFSLRVRLLSC